MKILEFGLNLLFNIKKKLDIKERWYEQFGEREPSETEIKEFASKYWGARGPELTSLGALACISGPWHFGMGRTL